MDGDIVKLSDSTFSLEGCLGFATIEKIRKKAKQFFQTDKFSQQKIQFDCSKLQHCDSAGIALIIEWKKSSLRKGIKMGFINMTTQMKNLMKLMELSTIFSVASEKKE